MTQPLKIGVIGAGGISRAHARAYGRFPKRLRLAAVCDVQEEAATRFAQEAGIDAVYTDAEQMLDHANIDAVDICTSHDQHAPLTIAAARAGKHVLVEKPMACAMQECRDMVQAAQESSVTLMVGQHLRYNPGYWAARQAIRDGELGTIRAVRLDAMQNLPAFRPPGHWLYDGERAGGGIVISVAVHRIDLARYFLGDAKRVTAICRTTQSEFINGAEDYACATIEFENGALGEMFATYSGFRSPYGEQVTIFGDTGALHTLQMGEERGPAVIASRKRGTTSGGGFAQQYSGFVPLEPDHSSWPDKDPMVNEMLHFVECCREKENPISSGRDNLDTMKIVFGIYESARTGKPVDLETL